MHLGEYDEGFKQINLLIKKIQYNTNLDELRSLLTFLAGAMLSAMGKHEKAGEYFFQTKEMGLPKFFTKSDLMFILARSFEQKGFDTSSEADDGGYEMV